MTLLDHSYFSLIDVHKAKIEDKWLNLRKKYTGIGLLWVLLFTFIFLLPYVVETFFYVVTSRLTEHISYEKWSLFEALLYSDKTGMYGKFYCALGIAVILYNAIRFFLTLFLSRVRS
ncbi:MAG: hypothetical protein SVR94_17500 [Pseudomonadota bacterium]|nr:hypothetical protein [Pseudomonadota bacterium]